MNETEKTELLKSVAECATKEMLEGPGAYYGAGYVSPAFGGVAPERYHYVEAVIFPGFEVRFDGGMGWRPVELRLSNDIEDAPAIIVLLSAMEHDGWIVSMDNHPSGVYRIMAFRERDPGYTCAISIERVNTNSVTRSEATAKAFVATRAAYLRERDSRPPTGGVQSGVQEGGEDEGAA